MSLVFSYLAMMPKLRAEDRHDRISFGYTATVSLESMQEKEASLKDAIDSPAPQPQRAAKPSPEALAAMGIGMVRVPAEAALHDG